MNSFADDIFTEPEDVDPDTLANLGPLARLAGIWEGRKGVDLNPKAEGPERRLYNERIEMQPIDPQANGPQLFYGLRYHVDVTTDEELSTFHDQVGYWLWEPKTGLVMQTLTIPRGQALLAIGGVVSENTGPERLHHVYVTMPAHHTRGPPDTQPDASWHTLSVASHGST